MLWPLETGFRASDECQSSIHEPISSVLVSTTFLETLRYVYALVANFVCMLCRRCVAAVFFVEMLPAAGKLASRESKTT